MKLNKLGFLSLLALLGILGMVMEHRPLLGFFGFAYYIRYFFVTPDEMFQQNVRRAASIGFFSGVGATGLAVAIRILLPEFLTNNMALAACYVVSVFSFSVVLVVLEIKEQRGC